MSGDTNKNKEKQNKQKDAENLISSKSIEDLKKTYYQYRLDLQNNKLKDTSILRKIRREIARKLTKTKMK